VAASAVRLLCDSRRFPVERRCRVSDQAARQERLAGFRAWAEADTGDRHEWLMTRGDAREWLAERDALAAQLEHAREALRQAELRISRLTFSRDMFRHRTALGSRVHNHVDHRAACKAYLALLAQEPYPGALVVPDGPQP
jgi:hypothetical protein